MVFEQKLYLPKTPADTALVLRIGLALVFISGGLWKLTRLLHPDYVNDILA